ASKTPASTLPSRMLASGTPPTLASATPASTLASTDVPASAAAPTHLRSTQCCVLGQSRSRSHANRRESRASGVRSHAASTPASRQTLHRRANETTLPVTEGSVPSPVRVTWFLDARGAPRRTVFYNVVTCSCAPMRNGSSKWPEKTCMTNDEL